MGTTPVKCSHGYKKNSVHRKCIEVHRLATQVIQVNNDERSNYNDSLIMHYLAKLWKQTEGYRNHQAKDKSSADVSNRSKHHWIPLGQLCPVAKKKHIFMQIPPGQSARMSSD